MVLKKLGQSDRIMVFEIYEVEFDKPSFGKLALTGVIAYALVLLILVAVASPLETWQYKLLALYQLFDLTGFAAAVLFAWKCIRRELFSLPVAFGVGAALGFLVTLAAWFEGGLQAFFEDAVFFLPAGILWGGMCGLLFLGVLRVLPGYRSVRKEDHVSTKFKALLLILISLIGIVVLAHWRSLIYQI